METSILQKYFKNTVYFKLLYQLMNMLTYF
jgi:hypothetical protein